MNKFTLIIHSRGWKVQDACDYWGIHYDTYNKRCNSAKFHNQLESMCMGLVSKNASFDEPMTVDEVAISNEQIITAMDDIKSQIKRLKG